MTKKGFKSFYSFLILVKRLTEKYVKIAQCFAISILFAFCFLISSLNLKANPLYYVNHWHLHQPLYWPMPSRAGINRWENAKESIDYKDTDPYSGHPYNDLVAIFDKDDREAAYQYRPKDSLSLITEYPQAGFTLSYTGALCLNVKSLGDAYYFEYKPWWNSYIQETREWFTEGGNRRMDIVIFGFHHPLFPLLPEEEIARKEIQLYKAIYEEAWGSPPDTKGFFPSEIAFSERIIPVLVSEGIEWTYVANSHISRCIPEWSNVAEPGTDYGTEPPNKADQVYDPNPGNYHWRKANLDGRKTVNELTYAYRPHYARYIDPETGKEYKIIVVPAADYEGYYDGYQMFDVGLFDEIAYYGDPQYPPLVILAHDGDNAWGGGYDSWITNTDQKADDAAAKGYTVSQTQEYLDNFPPNPDDIVHVEDGPWVNADSDFGSPTFSNWNWPWINNSDPNIPPYFDPNSWDDNSQYWAIMTALVNRVLTAQELAGTPDINMILHPENGSNDLEYAWHYLLGWIDSGHIYYGTSSDFTWLPVVVGNKSAEYADKIIGEGEITWQDTTPPTIWVPQRFPYNPGEINYGCAYNWKVWTYPPEFYVYTFVYDAAGLSSVKLKYRISTGDNTTPVYPDNYLYSGGSAVGDWQEIVMSSGTWTFKLYLDGNEVTDDYPDVRPKYLPLRYWAKIEGVKNKLVDYYVEAVDKNGNVRKSPIFHCWVGEGTGASSSNKIWTPEYPTTLDKITIYATRDYPGKLHWSVNNWSEEPNPVYWPENSTTTVYGDGKAVQTVLLDAGTYYYITIGPFNNSTQTVTQIDFVFYYDDGVWDNNNGEDWHIVLTQVASTPTVSIVYPENNEIVNGIVSIEATASDDVAVSSVTFFIDGTVYEVLTSTPYIYNWDTTSLPELSTHTIKVKAEDGDGNWSIDTVNVKVDNNPPQDITDLVALPGENEGTIILKWTSPSNDGTSVCSYIVKYSTFSNINNISDFYSSFTSTYTQKWIPSPPGTIETHTVQALLPGVTYYWAIISYDGVNYSSWTREGVNQNNFTYAQLDLISPDAVDDLEAIKGTKEGEIILKWTITGDDGSEGVFEEGLIKIYYDSNITSYSISGVLPQTQMQYSITGLTPGVTYYFKLKVVDNAGNESDFSNTASCVAPSSSDITKPQAITDLLARTGENKGEIILNWTSPSEANSYIVKYATFPILDEIDFENAFEFNQNWTPVRNEERVITGLSEMKNYFISIKVVDSGGVESDISNPAFALSGGGMSFRGEHNSWGNQWMPNDGSSIYHAVFENSPDSYFEFKFDPTGSWAGDNWGDSDETVVLNNEVGTASFGSGLSNLEADLQGNFYIVSFNSGTGEYSISKINSISLIGDDDEISWDPGDSSNFMTQDSSNLNIFYKTITLDAGQVISFKFSPNSTLYDPLNYGWSFQYPFNYDVKVKIGTCYPVPSGTSIKFEADTSGYYTFYLNILNGNYEVKFSTSPPPEAPAEPISVDGDFLDWKYEDIVSLDNCEDTYNLDDGYDMSRDIIALYYKEGVDNIYFRVDFYELGIYAENGYLDVYFAIDFKDGGQEWLPDYTDTKTDKPWELCIGVYDADNYTLYDSSWTNHSSYINQIAFNSALDSVEISVSKEIFKNFGWDEGEPFYIQCFTTKDGTESGDGEISGSDIIDFIGSSSLTRDVGDGTGILYGNISSTQTPSGRAKYSAIYHGNQSINLKQDIQDWIYKTYTDHTPTGYKRGLDTVENYGVKVNIHVSCTLASAIEWADSSFNERIRRMIQEGKVSLIGGVIAEHIMPYFEGEVNRKAIQLGNKYLMDFYALSSTPSVFWVPERVIKGSTFYDLKASSITAIVLDDKYHILDWFYGGDVNNTSFQNERFKIHKINGIYVFLINGVRTDQESPPSTSNELTYGYYDPDGSKFWNQDDGLHIGTRKLLLEKALSSDQEQLVLVFDDWEAYAGRSFTSEEPNDNADNWDKTVRWIANHQWIEMVTLEDILKRGWTPIDHGEDYNLPIKTYDWLMHACENSYDNWYYGSAIEESFYDYIPSGTTKKFGDINTSGTHIYDTVLDIKSIQDESLKEISWITFNNMIFETAWHDEDNTDKFGADDTTYDNISGWDLQLHSHLRFSSIYKEIDSWVNDVKNGVITSTSVFVLNKDIDGDDEKEFILYNNKIFAVFENEGGRMIIGVGYPEKGGIILTGNTFANYAYQDEREGDYHISCFRDSGYENDSYTVSMGSNFIEFTSSDGSIKKRIEIKPDLEVVYATYTTTNAVYVSFGLNPDIFDTFLNGKNNWRSIGSSASSYYGFENGSNKVYVEFLDSSFNSESDNSPLSHSIEVKGSGTFRINLVLGEGSNDTTPPSGIVDLKVSSVTVNSVILTWTSPGDDGTVGNILNGYFRICYSTNDTFTVDDYNVEIPTNVSSGEKCSYLIEDLSSGKKYYFAVFTGDEVPNWSVVSNTVSYFVNESPDTTPPSAPTLSAEDAGGGSILLSWTTPDDNDLSGFRIYRSTFASHLTKKTFIVELSSSDVSYLDKGLESLTYYYQIVSFDTSGNVSSPSNEASAFTTNNEPPNPPTNLIVKDKENDEGGSLELLWELSIDDGGGDNDVINYFVYRSTYDGGYLKIKELSSGTTVYIDTTTPKGVTFYYYIISYDGVYESIPSNISKAYSIDNLPPDAVTGFKATDRKTDGEIILTWTSNTENDLAGYKLYRTTSTSLSYSLISKLSKDTTYYIDKGLINGVTYYYGIKAFDTSGNESSFSYSSTFPTDNIPPSPPYEVKATDTEGGVIFVEWKVDESIYYFEVYRSTFSSDINSKIRISTTSDNYYFDTSVTLHSTYYYQIISVDFSLNKSSSSNEAYAFVSSTSRVNPPINLNVCDFEDDEGGSLILTWDLSIDEPDITGYWIYRSTDGINFSFYNSVVKGTTYFKDTELKNYQTYYYYLCTSRNGELSVPSNIDYAYPVDNLPPPAPSSGSAVDKETDGEIYLSWSEVSSSDLLLYRIYRSSDGFNFVLIKETANTSFIDSGLENLVTYYYKIRSVDTSYNESTSYLLLSAYPTDKTPPEILSFSVSDTGSGGTTFLSWELEGDDIERVSIYYSTYSCLIENKKLLVDLSFPVYSLVHSGLKQLTYFYMIRVIDIYGNYIDSEEKQAFPTNPSKPLPPLNLNAFDLDWDYGGKIKLSWMLSEDDTGGYQDVISYRIYRSTYDGGYALIDEVERGTSYYIDSVNTGTTYYYRITSYDGVYESAMSNFSKAYSYANLVEYNVKLNLVLSLKIEKPLNYSFIYRIVSSTHSKWNMVEVADKKEEFRRLIDVYEIYFEKGGEKITVLPKEIYLSFNYEKLNPAIANSISVLKLDEINSKWFEIEKDFIDIPNKEIRVKIKEFSLFTLGYKAYSDLSKVKVYPNPFKIKEAVGGVLKFINLPAQTKVKIYTISGELVFEGKSNTSTFEWNGKNNSGEYVAPGLYFYILRSPSGEEKRGKIALIW